MTGRKKRGRPAAPSPSVSRRLGAGLITGAADDDPSGIATYSQAGAQFGLDMLWTVALTYPLMVAVQSISARIGRVTGQGLAANLVQILPRAAVLTLVTLLCVANTINIGADLAAMGAAASLVAGGGRHAFTLGFALVTLGLQVAVPYHRYVKLLKWLTLALLSYVVVVLTTPVDWLAVVQRTVWPRLPGSGWIEVVVAVFGTTISPYLFFWQSAEEVEDEDARGQAPLLAAPGEAPAELARIGWDTVVGMGASNLIAFFIILTTAVTLHAHGVTDIQRSEDAALALKPLAGDLAFLLFALGIVGAGLLGVPVLSGSAGYAIAELNAWRRGLELTPRQAPGFYAVIVAAVILGLAVDYSGLDPIKALFWSAVINGVVAVPLMAAMMLVASQRRQMGDFVATPVQIFFGWTATAVMMLAAIALIVSTLSAGA